MRDLISVELLQPVTAPAGGHWNTGETAGFPLDVALDLISRGIAREAPIKAPLAPPAATKAVVAPPVDKMVRDATRKGR